MKYQIKIDSFKKGNPDKAREEVMSFDSKDELNNKIRAAFNEMTGCIPRRVIYQGGGNYDLFNENNILIGKAKTERVDQ